MQPILSATSAPTAGAVASSIVAPPVASRTTGRTRNVINYAELASADEYEDDTDDEEFANSRREKKKAAAAAAAALAAQSASSAAELDQSYLGKQPPAKFITTKVMNQTKHNYQYVGFGAV